jgi:hypothetical protein
MADYTRAFPSRNGEGREIREEIREIQVSDAELEADFLGALLIASSEEVREWTRLPEEIFSIERFRWIYAAIRDQAAARREWDPHVLVGILRERHGAQAPTLGDLLELASRSGAIAPLLPEYARRLLDLAGRRRLKVAYERAGRFLDRPDLFWEILEEARRTPGEMSAGFYTLAEELTASIPQPRMLVPGLLPAEGLTLLAARPKSGKSILAMNLLVAVTTGGVFLGRRIPEAQPALYLSLEDGRPVFVDRLREMCAGRLPGAGLVAYQIPHPLDTPEGRGWLRRVSGGMALVVIDTVGAALSPDHDWNDYGRMGPLFLRLHEIAMEAGCCILAVHHTRKSVLGEESVDAVLGSTAITAAAGTIWVLRRDREGEEGPERRAVLEIQARSFRADPIPIRLPPDFPVWQAAGEEEALPPTPRAILDLLTAQPEGLTAREIAQGLGVPLRTVQRALARLAQAGRIRGEVRPLPRGGVARVWRLS